MVDAASVPDFIMLLPAGPDLTTRDGRNWTYDPAEIVSAFAANQGPLVIDYEHAQELLAASGKKAPVAGWIVGMESRDGALWGKVEWTENARSAIASREYRFISPSLQHLADGHIVGLNGAGLVNRPALYLPPLDAQTPVFDEQRVQLAAVALASAARTYQTEQAALGRFVTITEAVRSVQSTSLFANT